MDRKDQAVKDIVDTGIIKLDHGITDVQNRIMAAGDTMHKSLDLADERFTDFEGLQNQQLGQVLAGFATRSVKVKRITSHG